LVYLFILILSLVWFAAYTYTNTGQLESEIGECVCVRTALVEQLVYRSLLRVEEQRGHVVVGVVGAEEAPHRGVDVLCHTQLGG